jgi:hypothetical protein
MMFGDRPQGGDGAGVRNPSMGRRRLFRGAPAAPGVNTGDVGRPADPGQEARMENFRRMLGLGRRDGGGITPPLPPPPEALDAPGAGAIDAAVAGRAGAPVGSPMDAMRDGGQVAGGGVKMAPPLMTPPEHGGPGSQEAEDARRGISGVAPGAPTPGSQEAEDARRNKPMMEQSYY